MNKPRVRLALFASGNGTNAEAIMNHFRHHPEVEVILLLSNNPEAFALERAKKFQVKTSVFTRQEFRDGHVLQQLKEAGATHIVLAGFLWLIPAELISAFRDHIVNIHPALLPKFGGKGMYGSRVHEAVKAAGDTQTGITIHLVNERYDEGRILFQAECEVLSSDTPDTIAAKVHALEYKHYPTVIEQWCLRRQPS
ncbi:MAG: phosphoribosylglycinamide formyltransferase [Cyclobacteriaceae bacterium]|nr:phosphoribosylglycinamide formyltransferase [Cyclobacteriaceae bacterium]